MLDLLYLNGQDLRSLPLIDRKAMLKKLLRRKRSRTFTLITSMVMADCCLSKSLDGLSNECKRILAYAAEEAERLRHRHIATEHLLLGILREEKCMAAQILQRYGLSVKPIREELARSLMPPTNDPGGDKDKP